MDQKTIHRLKVFSAKIRKQTIDMLKWRKYGHLGGSMSIVEVLSALYGEHLRHDPKNPAWEGRDYLVLSKGHSGPALYSTLALEGYFPKEWLYTLNETGTRIPSHPDRLKIPGVDATTGSLGQGTSVAAGLGLSLRLESSDRHVYLICGDGELNEGQCWEAFQFIAHRKLHEVITFVDRNGMQLDGRLEDIINPFDIAKKFEAFGFHAVDVKGNDEEAICEAIAEAKTRVDRPTCIVLHTRKCEGVPYYYGRIDNHSPKFNSEESLRALDEAMAAQDQVIGEEAEHDAD